MELFLDSYTSEEHAKRGFVVCELRLNRAYVDPAVRLSECSDPEEGMKKWTHAPKEHDVVGPITVMPLHLVRSKGVGSPSYVGVGGVERPVKRASLGTPEQVAHAHSSSPSSGTLGRVGAMGGEGVESSFGIAGLPFEESLASSIPSHVYDGDSEDSQVVPPTLWLDAIGNNIYMYILLSLFKYMCIFS